MASKNEQPQPGEIDTEVMHFRDGPPRKQYRVVQDVPVFAEHYMEPDGEDPGEYLGPDKLQVIAQNNNRRVEETGDATPITIGHTKDGLDENKQPKVVGFATNFRVHQLLNTNKQAIHADFHLMVDMLDEIKNYQRRSVEYWPKRMEIDPIALLGATTPEQDLGLLQLERPGKPRRYRRIYEEPEMAEKVKKNEAMPDGGGDSQSNLSDADIQKIVAALLESAPIKELLAAGQGIPPEGGEGPEGGMPPGGPEMEGGEGAPPPDGPMGVPHPEAAYFHEPHINYDHDNCDYESQPDEESEHYAYGSSTNDFVPGTGGMGHHPRGYAHAQHGMVPYGDEEFITSHKTSHLHPRKHSREAYEQWLMQQESARVAQDPRMQRIRQRDQAVRRSREDDEKKQLYARVQKLERDKRDAEREAVLTGLQAQGFDLDVAEEIGDCGEMTNDAFNRHVERIKKRYSRAPINGTPFRVAEDGPVGVRNGQMSREDAVQFAREVGAYRAAHPGTTLEAAKEAVRSGQM